MTEKQIQIPAFQFYRDWWFAIKECDVQAKARLLDALCSFAFEGVELDVPPELKVAMKMFKERLLADMEKYQKACERNKRNRNAKKEEVSSVESLSVNSISVEKAKEVILADNDFIMSFYNEFKVSSKFLCWYGKKFFEKNHSKTWKSEEDCKTHFASTMRANASNLLKDYQEGIAKAEEEKQRAEREEQFRISKANACPIPQDIAKRLNSQCHGD